VLGITGVPGLLRHFAPRNDGKEGGLHNGTSFLSTKHVTFTAMMKELERVAMLLVMMEKLDPTIKLRITK
jgi:hypothetical protein